MISEKRGAKYLNYIYYYTFFLNIEIGNEEKSINDIILDGRNNDILI